MLKIRGRDERIHLFRLEMPGQYFHYSRPISKYSLERLEDNGRSFTLAEARAWIASENVIPEPISQKEIDAVHRGVERGFDGQAAEETAWPKDNPPPPTKPVEGEECKRCGTWVVKAYMWRHWLNYHPGQHP